MSKYLLKNGTVVNEGTTIQQDILIKDQRIEKIGVNLNDESAIEINLEGKYVLPGCIDDQVHFREPGLTHKGNIRTESRAAVAGGITSFMEMPNTKPNATTQKLLEDKYQIATKDSIANYSFFMGATNDNLNEVLKTNPNNVCGVKVFMGSSTGNMLVDNEKTLAGLFSRVPMLIATHCEDELTVQKNLAEAKLKYGNEIPMELHPIIRSEEACYLSSSLAVNLAEKHGARLHVLHISTAKETELFRNNIPLNEKKITAEACVHHLWFSDKDYATKGTRIKWNPAVKSEADREGIWKALLDDRIDVIATDHAPHTIEEKNNYYTQAPSGGPLVQHALLSMMEHVKNGKITIERVVEKMAHSPAILFRIENRGFIREGYFADLVIVAPKHNYHVNKSNILYKCNWSPFEGYEFSSAIDKTFVNGNIVYENNQVVEGTLGMRLSFNPSL
ncbi:MAG: dihydroorotase [Crocinitomicaceae bacterium]|nr:dihydroorotase [Crocinitomicaceae bacterium]